MVYNRKNNKKTSKINLRLLLIIFIIFPMLITNAGASILNINKGTYYTTIQTAIDDSNIGDEIHVDSGTYYENVNIYKRLILKGIDMPVIDAGGGIAIGLNTDGIILEGFELIHSGEAGIKMASSGNTVKNNNVLESGEFGIYMFSSSSNILIDNSVNNAGYGIVLWGSSSNNNIINNNIYSTKFNGIGICQYPCNYVNTNNTLIGNNLNFPGSEGINVQSNGHSLIRNNVYFAEFAGIVIRSSDNILISNTVESNNVGISVQNSSSSNTLIKNNGSKNYVGLDFTSITNSVVRENNFSDNDGRGFSIQQSTNNIIEKNIFSNNGFLYCFYGGAGILSFDSNNNDFIGNIIKSNCNNGMYLKDSYYNRIFDNILVNDVNFIFFSPTGTISTNSWNTTKTSKMNSIGGYYIGGNFWGNPSNTGFSQICANRGDGFCDTSYTLDPGNIDYLPLTNNSVCGNTPEGQYIQTFPATNINMIFESIIQCGNTTASISDNQWKPLPDDYIPINFYNINTTAIYINSIMIKISYLDSDISQNINEPSIKLFHYENGDWIDITTSLDMISNKITGTVDSLSPFVIAGSISGGPTPTTSPTTVPTLGNNIVRGSSVNIVSIAILIICMIIISILKIRKV